ncbi:MAG TPA: hypothetical protein VJC00_03600 [Candidatus Nanoarchaeia archaeon]|nr:hypothetical protein [Candidatus Nanoarchaeia archaeon]
MRKLFKSKRAQDEGGEGGDEGEGLVMTHEWSLVVILSIVIPLIAMVFAMFVTGYQFQENSFLGDSENTVIRSRFFDSPQCFAYSDETTGRVYPGIIDTAKFSQKRMDACYDVPENYISGCFRIELKNIDTSQSIGTVESKNFGRCLVSGSVKKEPYNVLIKSGNDLNAGVMLVESNTK